MEKGMKMKKNLKKINNDLAYSNKAVPLATCYCNCACICFVLGKMNSYGVNVIPLAADDILFPN